MAFANPPYAAHVGGQDEKSLMGVVGTLGTADTGGTANILPVGVDPTTGALFVNNIGASSGGGGTNVNIITGTQQTLGTVGNLNNGSVNILSGTLLNTGTFVNISTGTVNLITTLSNLTNGSVNILSGTLQSAGTVTGVGVVSALTNGSINLLTGTLTSVTTVTTLSNLTNGSVNILTGTLQSSGTTTGVGVVTALTNGSINVLSGSISGTILGGTIQNLNAGTLTAVTTVTTVSNLTNGSVNLLTGTLANSGTTTGVGVVSNLTNGSVNILTGTITSVTNLAGGTIQINQVPTNKMTTYGTQGTAGAGTIIGTIQGTVGAGTEAIVSDWSMVVISGTPQVGLMFGSAGGAFPQGTGVIDAGQFPPGGGLAKGVESSLNSGTNGQICYMISAGTAYFKISYYVAATTI